MQHLISGFPPFRDRARLPLTTWTNLRPRRVSGLNPLVVDYAFIVCDAVDMIGPQFRWRSKPSSSFSFTASWSSSTVDLIVVDPVREWT